MQQGGVLCDSRDENDSIAKIIFTILQMLAVCSTDKATLCSISFFASKFSISKTWGGVGRVGGVLSSMTKMCGEFTNLPRNLPLPTPFGTVNF